MALIQINDYFFFIKSRRPYYTLHGKAESGHYRNPTRATPTKEAFKINLYFVTIFAELRKFGELPLT